MARRWVRNPDGTLTRISVTPFVLTIPQGVIVRLVWDLGGIDTAVNVLGALNPNAVTIDQAFANTVGASVKAALTSSNLAGSLGIGVALARVGLRNIAIANQFEFLDSGGPAASTGATDTMSGTTAYCVTIRTSLAGRSFRGRYYQWGAGEAANTNAGQPVASFQTQCAAFVNGVGAALSSHGLTPAVLSRKLATGTPWNTATARNTVWSSQRRRNLPGI